MSEFESAVTAFLLIKTNRAWLDLSVPERVAAFQENVLPAIEDKAKDVRRRYTTPSSIVGVENAVATNYGTEILASVDA
ncbi:darcynin family protein [Amycolatopsis speibonae]|uniref:Darcynin family protein n=1 Tax=Amycolatopsis speibonae TaxID=1450224 RepID=A0ABV7P3Q6_9PSEU